MAFVRRLDLVLAADRRTLFGLLRLSRALRETIAPPRCWRRSTRWRAGGAHALARETVSERRHRVTEKLTRASLELLMKAEGGLANLAVISSVSPFVGLFGTVWGIMASFVGIAAARDTSLAVVAPGIAEALAATAYGLAAAIPASIGYNRLGAAFSRLGQKCCIAPPTAPPNSARDPAAPMRRPRDGFLPASRTRPDSSVPRPTST